MVAIVCLPHIQVDLEMAGASVSQKDMIRPIFRLLIPLPMLKWPSSCFWKLRGWLVRGYGDGCLLMFPFDGVTAAVNSLISQEVYRTRFDGVSRIENIRGIGRQSSYFPSEVIRGSYRSRLTGTTKFCHNQQRKTEEYL